MNPPYGKSGSLSRQIVNAIFPFATQISCLAPIKSYANCFNNIAMSEEKRPIFYQNASQIFEDASGTDVTVAFITKENQNKIKDFETFQEEIVYNERQKTFLEAVDSYNKIHEVTYTAKDNIISPLAKKGNPYGEIYVPNHCRVFLVTWRNVGDGVHSEGGRDFENNLENKIVSANNDSANGLIFKSQRERDNFAKWWYSCNEYRVRKERVGLTNFVLDLLLLMSHGGVEAWYPKYFPNLDWSRPWNDREILKEIGLSEDFTC